MTTTRFNRRSLIKATAGAGAAAAVGTRASTAFAAPNVIQGGPVEVTWWASQSGVNGDAEQELVDAFNASQTEVKIVREFQGSYEETAAKLTAALQARQVPVLSTFSEIWWFKFYLNQALQPLNDYIDAAGTDTSDYVDSLWNEGRRNDTQYWVPMARSTPLFYYNKTAFEEAGVEESVVGNWADFAEAAPALVKKDGDTVSQYAFGHPNAAGYSSWYFQCVIWAFNGAYSDADFTIKLAEPEGIEAGNFFRDSVANGWAATSEDHTTDFTTGLFTAIMTSTGSMGNVRTNSDFEWGTAFIPEMHAFGCCTGGSGLSILAAAEEEKKEAAYQFVEWVTNTENTVFWSQRTGYLPVRKSAVNSAEMQAFFEENPQARTAVEQLPKTAPQDPARIYIPNGNDIIGGAIDQVTVNNVEASGPFEEASANLENEAQPVIEQLEAVEG
jgi:sn-glycerol 3-phosphate transport system substrate-binding protein